MRAESDFSIENEGSEELGGEHLRVLLDYIRRTEFKRMLNRIVMAQAEEGFRSISVLSEYPEEGRSFFISALALAYTRYLHSRVLIVETIEQTKNRSLFLQSVVGEHLPESENPHFEDDPGYIDLLTTRSLGEGEYDTADFQIGKYLQKLEGRYDLVLVDTCPLSEVNARSIDPYIIARHTEAAVLITSPQSMKRSIVSPIVEQVKRMGVRLLGTVYNGFAVQ
ncbi:MAG: hypothetical protein KDD55_09710 [Bdellovibrionales bacterium]|nr:hypothetical protein [Bdellovibrionales bacterium]